MDIKGELAYFTPEEERITGLKSPIPVAAVTTHFLWGNIYKRQFNLQQQLMADNDELTMAERAQLPYEERDLQRDRKIVEEMTAQIFAHQVELFPDTRL